MSRFLVQSDLCLSKFQFLKKEQKMPFLPDGLVKIRTAMGSKKRPLSRYRMAMQLGCTERTLLNWERGESSPNVKMLDKLAQVCHNNHLNHCEIYAPPPEAQDVRLFKGTSNTNISPICIVQTQPEMP